LALVIPVILVHFLCPKIHVIELFGVSGYFFRKALSYFFICSVSVQLLFELVVLLLLLLAAASNEVINQFFLLCYVAMDDDEFLSDADSGNAESEDDFAMNCEEENNSDSMNVGEVLSSLDFVLFVHLCIIII